jgi:mono/diheme cytochrome c family protein
MNKSSLAILGVGVVLLALRADAQQPQPPTARPAPPAQRAGQRASGALAPALAVSHAPAASGLEGQSAMVKQYCAPCHSDRGRAGGQSFASFDAARVGQEPEATEIAEKMIRKVRAGMMPPAGARRPEPEVLATFVTALESRIDQLAAVTPRPGRRPFQRLNRAEYARAVKELLDLDVDVSQFLPADTISGGFDNVADVQRFSATLMEGYLRAASRIAAVAVGDPKASPTSSTFKVPRTGSQMQHVDGAPFGTRGGISLVHTFLADGEYTFRMQLHSIPTGQLFGSTVRGETIEVSIDGERVALVEINPRMSESDPNGMNLVTPRVSVKAGARRVSAAFPIRFDAPPDDLLAPIDHTLADTQIGSGFGVTTLPHLREFEISGPFAVTGVSDTPTRRRIFTCRPTSAPEEKTCSSEIVRRLATAAYRAPLAAEDFDGLYQFYVQGRKDGGDFESGIRLAVQAMLASPRFLFRLERAGEARPGQPYRLADLEFASRLSFFLWGVGPDAELLKASRGGALARPAGLQAEVTRMLADPRAGESLATRFAAQWLRLQDLDKIYPDALLYPYYDYNLGEAFRHETELFFSSLVREDHSLLDLLTANYTFVNERVARHYGIPNVSGPEFRRVTLADEARRGILGHGSILTLTSVADRTSPVQRGKWIMEVLLGSPPPAPPPNVPSLDDSVKAEGEGKMLTTRERMEQHRANPACNSCHRVIDPLGLALENFDVTGRWRIRDNGALVDAVGELYDGTSMNGPAGLRAALLKHQDMFILSFAERLMTYALGRRVEYYDMPAIRRIIRDAAKNDYRISSFVLGIARSAAFQMSQAEDTSSTGSTGSAGSAGQRPQAVSPKP